MISELANFDATESYGEAPQGSREGETSAVGLFPANDWGLHDLHGNVWEWCLDAWHDSCIGAPDDGRARVSEGSQEPRRLLRGGGWVDVPGGCRSANRRRERSGYAFFTFGLRMACHPRAHPFTLKPSIPQHLAVF